MVVAPPDDSDGEKDYSGPVRFAEKTSQNIVPPDLL